MKAFFIGTVQMSRELLDVLVTLNEIEIVGIATKSKSSFNADHTDLSDVALERDIPYKYVRDINAPHIVEWIRSLNPDVVLCFGWSSLIGPELLQLANKGVIGYHPAALPQNRGRHPIIWALALGLNETASTFFVMEEGADSGDIIHQEKLSISESDDAQSLYQKLILVAKKQIPVFIEQLHSGTEELVPQNESKSNEWRKRGKLDGLIDFRMPSEGIYNLVRALTKPYVGAHLTYKNEDHKVWKVEVGPDSPPNIEPGKVLAIENSSMLIKSGNGTVWIREHEVDVLPEINEYIL